VKICETPFFLLLKSLSMPNCALFVVSARARSRRGRLYAGEVCPQVDMAYDILRKARTPLHINDLLERIRSGFGIAVDRESLVSSLTKKVARGTVSCAPDEYVRSAPGGAMTLLAAFMKIVRPWHSIFPQQRSSRRAIRQALGSLVCLGRRTLSRIIWTNGGQDRSWGAEYLLHSRCR